jgi:hypothetical protein
MVGPKARHNSAAPAANRHLIFAASAEPEDIAPDRKIVIQEIYNYYRWVKAEASLEPPLGLGEAKGCGARWGSDSRCMHWEHLRYSF